MMSFHFVAMLPSRKSHGDTFQLQVPSLWPTSQKSEKKRTDHDKTGKERNYNVTGFHHITHTEPSHRVTGIKHN